MHTHRSIKRYFYLLLCPKVIRYFKARLTREPFWRHMIYKWFSPFTTLHGVLIFILFRRFKGENFTDAHFYKLFTISSLVRDSQSSQSYITSQITRIINKSQWIKESRNYPNVMTLHITVVYIIVEVYRICVELLHTCGPYCLPTFFVISCITIQTIEHHRTNAVWNHHAVSKLRKAKHRILPFRAQSFSFVTTKPL